MMVNGKMVFDMGVEHEYCPVVICDIDTLGHLCEWQERQPGKFIVHPTNGRRRVECVTCYL